MERWDAAAGGEQPGKEGPCSSAQSIQARWNPDNINLQEYCDQPCEPVTN